MRDLTITEIEEIGGAQGPLGSVAGGVVAGVGYVGMKAGSGTEATWNEAGQAVIGGAIGGFFTPVTAAGTAAAALGAFYGGLGGGYIGRIDMGS